VWLGLTTNADPLYFLWIRVDKWGRIWWAFLPFSGASKNWDHGQKWEIKSKGRHYQDMPWFYFWLPFLSLGGPWYYHTLSGSTRPGHGTRILKPAAWGCKRENIDVALLRCSYSLDLAGCRSPAAHLATCCSRSLSHDPGSPSSHVSFSLSSNRLTSFPFFYCSFCTSYLLGKASSDFSSVSREGHPEPASTSVASTGCLLLLGSGWTSTELIFGFTLVTNFVGNRSRL
jgi:hypothetical protein